MRKIAIFVDFSEKLNFTARKSNLELTIFWTYFQKQDGCTYNRYEPKVFHSCSSQRWQRILLDLPQNARLSVPPNQPSFPEKNTNKHINCNIIKLNIMYFSFRETTSGILSHCTEVRFANLLSGGVTTYYGSYNSTGKESSKMHLCAPSTKKGTGSNNLVAKLKIRI